MFPDDETYTMEFEDFIKLKCERCNYEYEVPKARVSYTEPCPLCYDRRPKLYKATIRKPKVKWRALDCTGMLGTHLLGTQDLDLLTKSFNTPKEDKNMKKQEEKTNNELMIRRDYTTERGVFTIETLEPTDMFVLIDDESQTVYMAIDEGEPRFKTKTAIIEMKTGKLCYINNDTKIHVYRRNQTTLHVGEFEYPTKDYD